MSVRMRRRTRGTAGCFRRPRDPSEAIWTWMADLPLSEEKSRDGRACRGAHRPPGWTRTARGSRRHRHVPRHRTWPPPRDPSHRHAKAGPTRSPPRSLSANGCRRVCVFRLGLFPPAAGDDAPPDHRARRSRPMHPMRLRVDLHAWTAVAPAANDDPVAGTSADLQSVS